MQNTAEIHVVESRVTRSPHKNTNGAPDTGSRPELKTNRIKIGSPREAPASEYYIQNHSTKGIQRQSGGSDVEQGSTSAKSRKPGLQMESRLKQRLIRVGSQGYRWSHG
ncbi:hypothetical protein Adt_11355 [Abeliophyllum distichum]|uniref:Uncharacterized protein n=1 Tax=Abeliophyllum distichum TaxID=126358 RepID=A0ABD1UMK8_9LAMI